jgi:hypothetical protein
MQSIATAGQPTDLGLEQAGVISRLLAKKWVSLDPTIVYPRIDELTSDPNKITQGVLGLCGPAALCHHAAQKDPPAFSSFAKALFGGEGFLGNFKIAASQSLLNADYAALLVKWPKMPPQADWMILASIRDSKNWLLAFTGTPDDERAIRTQAKEVSGWYNDTGFYSSVSYSDDKSPAAIKAIAKAPNNHIALAIDCALIDPNNPGGHVITLESPITIDPAADTASFDYWTWGRDGGNRIKTLNTTWTNLQKYYWASIVATF